MADDKAAQEPGVSIPNPGPIKQEHGAQVVLQGEARAAARGGLHGDILSNTIARDAAVGRGEAADGTTPDGSTPDGRLPADTAQGADQPEFGPPGEGEGKPGFRPGDEKVAQAEADAAAERAKAKPAPAPATVQTAPAATPAPAAPTPTSATVPKT